MFSESYIQPATIFSMVEAGKDAVTQAGLKLDAAKQAPRIVSKRESGPFDVYEVESGVKVYQVIILGWMVWCSCPDFAFTHRPCKHIAECLPKVCIECFEVSVSALGLSCSKCLMDNAPYLPATNDRQPERVGNIRI